MDVSFFFKGVTIGFSIAAPVGPIGVLCIRRSLADGAKMGLCAGLGAATADAAYGCVAAFSLTAISVFLIRGQAWLALLGGIFLCYLGVRTFLSKPAKETTLPGGNSFFTVYLSTLFLTLANPATILSFVAIFAGFGLGVSNDYFSAGAMVLGVFTGSAFWWLILSSGVGMLRSQVNTSWMQFINRFSGSLLFAFGLYALSKA